MRILVTGSNGYVGAAVSTALASRGHTVVALVRSESESQRARSVGHAVAAGELTDAVALRQHVAAVDGVFHGAASPHPDFARTNAAALEVMLGALGAGQSFAMQGGTGVFGDTGDRVFDGTEAPRPPPALATQSALEQRVLGRGEPAGPRTYVVYGALVYGGQGAMIPNVLLSSARRAGAGQYPGLGDNRWSTVFLADWAELIARLLERGPARGGPFVASGGEASLRNVASSVAAAIGAAGDTVSLPAAEAAGAWGFFAPLLACGQRFSSQRALDAVGWKPTGPSLDDELRRLAQASEAARS